MSVSDDTLMILRWVRVEIVGGREWRYVDLGYKLPPTHDRSSWPTLVCMCLRLSYTWYLVLEIWHNNNRYTDWHLARCLARCIYFFICSVCTHNGARCFDESRMYSFWARGRHISYWIVSRTEAIKNTCEVWIIYTNVLEELRVEETQHKAATYTS